MIFPELKSKIFGYVNLNIEAELWMKNKKPTPPKDALLDASLSGEMVEDVQEKYGLDFSYGGWMEDRSFLWKGTYLEPLGTYIHLGIDVNAPAGTDISVDFDAEVVRIDDDYPEEGGWGPRVTFKYRNEPLYFIYAHLDRDIKCKVGDVLDKGKIFAKVGKAPYNGNWFPHVHIQTIREEYYKELTENGLWHELDGYGSPADLSKNVERFPDPLQYISLT
jgi:murein DD-endopeptidase MepM/ murein hydrolase activator NlpD